MAVIRLSARYGSGKFGLSKYDEEFVSIALTGVVGTTALGSVTLGPVSVTLTGVSAKGFVAVSTDEIEEAAALGSFDSVAFRTSLLADFGVGNSVTPTGVAATGQVQAITTIHVEAGLISQAGTGAIGALSTSSVIFDFEAVREQYSRRRSVTVQRAA